MGVSYIGYQELPWLAEFMGILPNPRIEAIVDISYVTTQTLNNTITETTNNCPEIESIAKETWYEYIVANKGKILLTVVLIISLVGINMLMPSQVPPALAEMLNKLVGNENHKIEISTQDMYPPVSWPIASRQLHQSNPLANYGITGTVLESITETIASSTAERRTLFLLTYMGHDGGWGITALTTMVCPYAQETLASWFDGVSFSENSFNYSTVVEGQPRNLLSFKMPSEVISLSAKDYENWCETWHTVQTEKSSLTYFVDAYENSNMHEVTDS